MLKGQYIHIEQRSRYNNSFEKNILENIVPPITDLKKNISLWEGVGALKGQYISTSYNNREYFTLGGCCGLERSIHMNKLQ